MNKKKLIAAVICLVLVITAALPGTLAVSADAASSDGTISVATPETAQTPADPAVTVAAAPQNETEQPAEPETPAEPKTCTCDPAPAEGEAHKEGCPLYVAPEKPDETPVVHIEGCSDDCKVEDCKCICHLMKKIMECKTLEEIWGVLGTASEDTLKVLTEEQIAKIETKIEELEPAPVPAVVLEKSSDETAPSEIVQQTVNYTYVAPFGAPVSGGN